MASFLQDSHSPTDEEETSNKVSPTSASLAGRSFPIANSKAASDESFSVFSNSSFSSRESSTHSRSYSRKEKARKKGKGHRASYSPPSPNTQESKSLHGIYPTNALNGPKGAGEHSLVPTQHSDPPQSAPFTSLLDDSDGDDISLFSPSQSFTPHSPAAARRLTNESAIHRGSHSHNRKGAASMHSQPVPTRALQHHRHSQHKSNGQLLGDEDQQNARKNGNDGSLTENDILGHSVDSSLAQYSYSVGSIGGDGHSFDSRLLPTDLVKVYAVQIISAFHHLHSNGFIYGCVLLCIHEHAGGIQSKGKN